MLLLEDLHLAKRFYDMATEHSEDAFAPVLLALFKLYAHFALQYLTQVRSVDAFEVRKRIEGEIFAQVYALSVKATDTLFIIVKNLYFRRTRLFSPKRAVLWESVLFTFKFLLWVLRNRLSLIVTWTHSFFHTFNNFKLCFKSNESRIHQQKTGRKILYCYRLR